MYRWACTILARATRRLFNMRVWVRGGSDFSIWWRSRGLSLFLLFWDRRGQRLERASLSVRRVSLNINCRGRDCFFQRFGGQCKVVPEECQVRGKRGMYGLLGGSREINVLFALRKGEVGIGMGSAM